MTLEELKALLRQQAPKAVAVLRRLAVDGTPKESRSARALLRKYGFAESDESGISAAKFRRAMMLVVARDTSLAAERGSSRYARHVEAAKIVSAGLIEQLAEAHELDGFDSLRDALAVAVDTTEDADGTVIARRTPR